MSTPNRVQHALSIVIPRTLEYCRNFDDYVVYSKAKPTGIGPNDDFAKLLVSGECTTTTGCLGENTVGMPTSTKNFGGYLCFIYIVAIPERIKA